MRDWFLSRLFQLEAQLRQMDSRLSPWDRRVLADKLDSIRQRLTLGQGAYFLGATDHVMFFGTKAVEEALEDLLWEIENLDSGRSTGPWQPPFSAGGLPEDDDDEWDDMDTEDDWDNEDDEW